MNLKNIIKKASKSDIDDVILILSEQEASQLKFANSKIVKTGVEFIENLFIFVAKDKKLAITSIKDLSENSVDKTIKNITRFVKNLKPNKNYMGIASGKFKYKEIKDSYDNKIVSLGDKAVDIVEDAINIAHSNGAKRTAGIFEAYNNKVTISTSNNIEATDKSTEAYFSFRSLISKKLQAIKQSAQEL